MTDLKKIWALCDDRAGNVSQCLGVAEALGQPFERKNILYNRLAALPNGILGQGFHTIDRAASSPLSAPWPDLVIAAGRRTAPIARAIKKASKGHTKLVHLMTPTGTLKDFDLIIRPAHDKPLATHHPQLTITGAAHRITAQQLSEAKDRWAKVFAFLPAPYTGVIIGGATKNKETTDDDIKKLAADLNAHSKHTGGSLLITTSRRTKASHARLLKSLISGPNFLYAWGDAGENPYFGILANSSDLIVTGDSVSMCAECCATGKPVQIYTPDAMVSAKHQRMIQSFLDCGAATLFGADQSRKQPFIPLTTMDDIVQAIQGLFHDENAQTTHQDS